MKSHYGLMSTDASRAQPSRRFGCFEFRGCPGRAAPRGLGAGAPLLRFLLWPLSRACPGPPATFAHLSRSRSRAGVTAGGLDSHLIPHAPCGLGAAEAPTRTSPCRCHSLAASPPRSLGSACRGRCPRGRAVRRASGLPVVGSVALLR